MAELPDLGHHCSWLECQQLDFLPITCVHCKKSFCKDHYPAETHSCPEKPNHVVADLASLSRPENYPCCVEGCGRHELSPITCPHCNVQVCLAHRHQQDHSCKSLVIPTHKMTATKAVVDQIINKDSVTKSRRKLKSKAAQKTAAKVQLMKLKQHSVGVAGVPHSERIHFLVTAPNGKNLGCWVSSTWTIGKVVDSLAQHTGTVNQNNVAGANKLKMVRADDGSRLCERMDRVLGDMVKEEEVLNGDNIILVYDDVSSEL